MARTSSVSERPAGPHRSRSPARGPELLWAAGASLSSFGDDALVLVFALWIKHLTGSASAAAFAFLAYLAPAIFAPVAGLLADRLPRARLLIGNDLAQAALVSLALVVGGAGQVGLLYLVLFGIGLGASVQSAAASALISELVPAGRRGRLNSVFRTGEDVALCTSPVLGALLYGSVGPYAVIAIEIGTYAVSAAAVLQLRSGRRGAMVPASTIAATVPPTSLAATGTAATGATPITNGAGAIASHPVGGRVLRELAAGAAHILATRELRRLVGSVSFALLLFGMFEPVLLDIASTGPAHRASFAGVLLSLNSLGSVAGGALCVAISDRIGPARLVRLGLLVVAAGTIPLLIPSALAAGAGCLIMGLGFPMTGVGIGTSVQRNTPNQLQGRVAAAAKASRIVCQAIAVAAGSVLIGVVSVRWLVLAMCLGVSIGWLLLMASAQSGN